MEAQPPLYSLRDLRKSRVSGPGYALHIPSLDIEAGALLAITGPSGCGKSTALDLFGMALRPDAAGHFLFRHGELTMDVARCWQDGDQDSLAALRLRHMGYILQTGGLLPYLTAGENMELTARLNALPDSHEHSRHLAHHLGIARLWNAMPGTLSVGERQRVAIVRALAARPSVILADEPTAALDPLHAATVLELLLEAVQEQGATLIMVTHDQATVRTHQLRELPITISPQADGSSLAVLEAPHA